MVSPSFLSTLFFALAVAAHPAERATRTSLAKLRFRKCISDGLFDIVALDRRRVDFFRGTDVFNVPVENTAVSYVASVGVGSPPTAYNLIIDTGSANIWLGANKAYVKTSTSQKTSESVSVKYGSGGFNGTEYIDQITISEDLVIPKQSIGVAKEWKGFDTVNGIIGVGPANLTNGTLSPDKKSTIPTVTDNLFAEYSIGENVLSISFEPITNSSGKQMNGELTWGGVDYTKFIGDITYVPITSTPPSSNFWGINASMTYGDTPIQSNTAGLVDTGSSLVLIATDAFDRYQKATGAVLDKNTQLLKVTPAQYKNLKSFFIYVEGVPFELTPNAQLWPRNLNSLVGGTADGLYLTIGDIGTKTGAGKDFLLGQPFLERFYSVYDTGNHRVGLARTRFTNATTN